MEPMSEQVAIESLHAPPDPARAFVRDLADGDDVAAPFVVRERDRRSRKNGEDFIRLVIADRTGSVAAVAWDAVEECFDCSAPGTIVFVEGRFTVHGAGKDAKQLTLQSNNYFAPKPFDLGPERKDLKLTVTRAYEIHGTAGACSVTLISSAIAGSYCAFSSIRTAF